MSTSSPNTAPTGDPTPALSPEREQEIRDRRAAIVDTPWGSRRDLEGQYTVQADAFVTFEDGFASSGDVASIIGDTESERYRRAGFVARAPRDIDALLAEIERLRAARDRFEAILNDTSRLAGRQANEVERLRGEQKRALKPNTERALIKAAVGEALVEHHGAADLATKVTDSIVATFNEVRGESR